jgi:hypothetical protein
MPFSQYCSRPSAQGWQCWQLSTMQPTPTMSPTLNLETPSPTAFTRPTISWPGTQGKMEGPHSLLAVCRSEWQTPQCRMSMATSRAAGVRRSKVKGARGVVAERAA